jgi:hypothetical protein
LGNRHATQVTLLVTGAQVCNHCPAYREECAERERLAARVLAIVDDFDPQAQLDRRRAFLAEYGAAHGAEAQAKLEAAVRRVHAARRAALQGAE